MKMYSFTMPCFLHSIHSEFINLSCVTCRWRLPLWWFLASSRFHVLGHCHYSFCSVCCKVNVPNADFSISQFQSNNGNWGIAFSLMSFTPRPRGNELWVLPLHCVLNYCWCHETGDQVLICDHDNNSRYNALIKSWVPQPKIKHIIAHCSSFFPTIMLCGFVWPLEGMPYPWLRSDFGMT